ncbi:MAG: protein HflC [bacterium]|nr:MAG: protein HflC [bacterium]
MNNKYKALMITAAVVAAAVLLVLGNALFVVKESEQAVILKFGKFVKSIREPGLHFKMPMVQQVTVYDKRLLDYDVAPTEIVTKDKRTLLIDSFSKWRIVDPEAFYKRVRNEIQARGRIKDVIFSELWQEFGQHTLEEIVSVNRRIFMESVTKRSHEKLKGMNVGIEIVDGRRKRADLPDENEVSVFKRMREERKRIATQFRSEGDEEANKIRARADKEKILLLADAYLTEQKTRGEGDAKSIKIYADAYRTDPEFYEFTRSLEAYGKALGSDNVVILTDQSEFLKYFNKSGSK